MSQPTAYNPAHEFLTDEGANPNFPGSEIDIELNALETTLDEILTNLALIQRDDGALANAVVTVDALSDAVKAMIGDADVLAALEIDFAAVDADVLAAAASASAAAASASTATTQAGTATAKAVLTAADAVSTAADAVSTAADAIATAADRVQTGLDAATATTQAGLAQTAATAAASSLDSFDDRYLGAKASDPTLDNDGNALLTGSLYWNTTSGLKIYDGAAWDAYSAVAGILSLAEDTTPQLGGMLDVNGQALGDGTLELLKFEETASAVNEVTLVNAATGNGPTVKATGDDTNIDLVLAGKGTGVPKISGAAIIKASGAQTLTGGYKATPYAKGTVTTGTYTPLYSDGNFQTATNGGAHTLAPPADDCTVVIQYTNNASAGAITTSGFTKVTGSTISTTNADDFFFFITKVGSFSHLHVQALQ